MKQITFSQFAVMNMNYKFYPWSYFLDALVDMHVQNINLYAGHPHLLLDRADNAKVQRIKQDIQARGLHVVCMTPEQNILPFNVADEDIWVRNTSIQQLMKCLDISAELECNTVQVCPGYGWYNQPIDAAFDRAASAFRAVSTRASELGITIILEPLQIVESNLVGDIASSRKMLDAVGCPNFKLMVDTCHMAVKGEQLEDYFTEFGEKIHHIHFNDTDQVPCGEGDLPLAHYLDVLEHNNFAGYLTLEICSYSHYIDAAEATRSGVEHIRSLLAARYGAERGGRS